MERSSGTKARAFTALGALALLGLSATGCSTVNQPRAREGVNPTGFQATLEHDAAPEKPFEHAAPEAHGLVALLELILTHNASLHAPDGIAAYTAGDQLYLQQPGSSLMLRVDPHHAAPSLTPNATASAGEGTPLTPRVAADDRGDVFFAIGDIYSLGLASPN